MSDFWANNKGSIMSGLATAGKYGYQGTKFVAKTGYNAAKTQYNNSDANRKKNENSPEPGLEGPVTSLNNLSDPSLFPPPPLKPGQKQYSPNSDHNLSVTDQEGFTPTPYIPQERSNVSSQSYHTDSIQEQSTTNDKLYTRAPAPPPIQIQSEYIHGNNDHSRIAAPSIPQRRASSIISSAPNSVTGSVQSASQISLQEPSFQPPAQSTPLIAANTPVPSLASQPSVAAASVSGYGRPPVCPPANINDRAEPKTVSQPAPLATIESKSPSPSVSVTPYQWTDSEERKQKNRIEMIPIEADTFQAPPLHRGRSSAVGFKDASQQDGASLQRTTSDLSSMSISSSKSSSVASEATEERVMRSGISGAYVEPESTFAPPPRPSNSRLPPRPHPMQNTTPHSNSQVAPNPKNFETPPLPSSTKRPSLQTNYGSRADHGSKHQLELSQQTAVLGSYNYDVDTGFAPPPKPFKSGEQQAPQAGNGQHKRSTQNSFHVSTTVPSMPATQTSSSTSSLHSLGDTRLITSSTIRSQQILENQPPAPPRRSQPPSSVTPSPALPSRSFDPPPRYATIDSLPQYDEAPLPKQVQTELLSIHGEQLTENTRKIPPPVKPKSSALRTINAKKSPPIVPKKKHSLQTASQKHSPPQIPTKKFTLADLETKLHSNAASNTNIEQNHEPTGTDENEDDDQDSIDNNPFRKYLKNAVPKDYDHIHKHD